MRFRLVHETGLFNAKRWAVIVEADDGARLLKRDYKTRQAAEAARSELMDDMR